MAVSSIDCIGTFTELDEVDSTNSYLQRELIREDKSSVLPWVVTSKRQTAGRGRNGNSWLSHENSITFSIAWQPETQELERLSMLPLHIGVAVSEAVRPFVQSSPKVKWPNDVMLDGKKLAGILIESFRRPNLTSDSRSQIFVIGIGLNVANEFTELQSEIASKATSVREHLNPSLEISDQDLASLLFESILHKICSTFKTLSQTTSDLMEKWSRYCFLTGKQVSVDTSSGLINGECHGIDDRGAIVICDDSGELRSTLSGQVVYF